MPKCPRDTAQLAKYIVDVATGALPNVKPVVDEAAVRRGTARAAALTPARRNAIAKKAAAALLVLAGAVGLASPRTA